MLWFHTVKMWYLLISKNILKEYNYIINMQQMKDREGLDTTMLGTQFDRQVRIDGWDQKAVRG